VCQFQISLHYALLRLPPPTLPCNFLPAPLKAIARGFTILSHKCIWSPSTIFPHLHPLHSPSHLSRVPHPNTHYTCLIVLSFISNSKVSIPRGLSMHPSCEYRLHWSVQSPRLVSLIPPPTLLFNSFQYILLCPLHFKIIAIFFNKILANWINHYINIIINLDNIELVLGILVYFDIQKSTNIIYHVKSLLNINYMITQIYTEKEFEKNLYSLMIKNMKK
jgi:hypothetical protein